MIVNCKNCGESLILDKNQVQLVENLKKKGSTFGMLPCKSCGLSFSINPQDLDSSDSKIKETTWRSPIAGSHGFVSFVDNVSEKPFYGCGETGVIWSTRDSFYKDIESIINKYPHRSSFYKKTGDDWFPAKDEPKNIDELIDSEDLEHINTYQR